MELEAATINRHDVHTTFVLMYCPSLDMSRAIPKSATFATSPFPTKTFLQAKSRWMHLYPRKNKIIGYVKANIKLLDASLWKNVQSQCFRTCAFIMFVHCRNCCFFVVFVVVWAQFYDFSFLIAIFFKNRVVLDYLQSLVTFRVSQIFSMRIDVSIIRRIMTLTVHNAWAYFASTP